jgi:alcohol dehydrogenase
MAKSAKAAVLVEPKRIEIQEFPLPQVGPDEGLIRIERAGVCGTDPKIYRGLSSGVNSFPLILGHEILGRIEQIGDRMAARNGLEAGDRVIVESAIPCGGCAYCKQGFYKFCKRRQGYGTRVTASTPPHLWGAFSEYMYLAPNSIIHKIRDQIKPQAAIVAAACLGNGIRWIRTMGGATIGKPVVIQGVGPQGLAAVVAAKDSGAFPIIVTGLSNDSPRLALAKKLGADICVDVEKQDVLEVVSGATKGELADTVLDVTGNPRAIALSVELVKPLGTLICAGTIPGRQPATLMTNSIVNKEVRFQGVFGHSLESTVQAIRLAETGKYPLENIISHEFPLNQTDLAIRAAGRELDDVNPTKVALVP